MGQQRERRYIADYMLQFFPGGNWMLNVELGPLPAEMVEMHGEEGAALRYRPWRRRIDAVAWTPEKYYLIETKLRDPLQGLGRLQTYLALAKRTGDLAGYEGQPIILRLVVPFSLEWIKVACEDAQVELVVWMPAWVTGYFLEINKYWTAEYKAKRDETNRMRDLLGLR